MEKTKKIIIDEGKFKIAVRSLYKSANNLRISFPGKKFTPDGRMVGDIGEAIGEILYDLELYPKANHAHWDGYWINKFDRRIEVQIRATQRNTTYFKEPVSNGSFLVFKINSEKMGEYDTVYNGNIMRVWNEVKQQKRKEKWISLVTLKNLQKESDPYSVPRRD